MKAYFLQVVGLVYLGLMLFCIHSCSVTQCLGVACANGTCIDGKCNCNFGFEGPSCKTIIRNKFLGVYTVSSSCFINETYNAEINYVTTTNYNQMIIENVSNLRINVTANIVDSLHITVPSQTDTSGGQIWVVSGSGYINSGRNIVTMQMTYYNAANNLTNNCAEIYTKK